MSDFRTDNLSCEGCPLASISFADCRHTGDCKEVIMWLDEHDEHIRAEAEAEHKAMCKTCIHKVSADDLRAIKYDAVDELSNRCITHIKQSKPLTIEEIIHIIHFNADQMKGE